MINDWNMNDLVRRRSVLFLRVDETFQENILSGWQTKA